MIENDEIEDFKQPIIGLFGTYENSTWRDEFIEIYESEELGFYNPYYSQNPDHLIEDQKHLKEDEIILFHITSESYAIDLLYDIQSIIEDKARFFVIIIDDDVTDELKQSDPEMAKASKKIRLFVKNLLQNLQAPNFYIVDNIEQLLEGSIILYQAAIAKNIMSKFHTNATQKNLSKIIS